MKRRISKKLRKNSILVLDIASVPQTMTYEDWFVWIVRNGMIFYNSHEGNIPTVVPSRNRRVFKFIDKSKDNDSI